MNEINNYTSIKYLYNHEKEKLFNTVKYDTSRHHVRNYAIFLLAEYCGLRASELGIIRMSDYNDLRKEIYIRRLKNSNSNTLRIIDQDVLDALYEYFDLRSELDIYSDYMFPSQKGGPISRKTLDMIMKHYCRLAGIPKEKAHFHVLKHTRAVELGELGLDIKEIQFWIGHKEIQNTQIYMQFTTKQQDQLYEKIKYFDLLKNKEKRD